MIKRVKRCDFSGVYHHTELWVKSDHRMDVTFITFLVVFMFLPLNIKALSVSSERSELESVINETDENTREITAERDFNQVITESQLRLFSDRTVQEAMARIVGVQVNRSGRFNIRGTSGAGTGLYNVTFNGQRMATTGKGNRRIELGGISTDLAGQMEVVKVVTPDMDADAIGGQINIKSRRPVDQGRQFNIMYGGGYNSEFSEYTRPDNRASLFYSETFGDQVDIAAGLTHQRNVYAWESLGITYDIADFGSGYLDVIENISPSLNISEWNNWGGFIEFNYQPTNTTRYFINSNFNTNMQGSTRHRVSMSANGDWANQFEIGRQGSYGYEIHMKDHFIRQVMAQAGAIQNLDAIELKIRLGWSQGNLRGDQFSLPFLSARQEYTVNMDDRTRPYMEAVEGPVRSQDLRLQPMNEVKQEHNDNTFTGNFDIDIPYDTGFIRIGSGAILSNKTGDFRDTILRDLGAGNLSTFQMEEGKEFSVLDQSEYMIPWYVTPENVNKYFNYAQYSFRRERELVFLNSDIWNYEALEGVYSGYGMASWNVGLLNVKGGVRIEYTNARYNGNDVLFSDIGFHRSTTDTTVNHSYTHLFPNLQLKLAPSEQSNIIAAYSRTIARPDYHVLTPFRLHHILDETVFRGNPGLEPLISDNLDLMLEYNPGSLSHFSLGLFYKNMSNFVVERIRTIEGGELDGYVERTFEIGDESADLYGVEISWQQDYSFLPGVLGNLGTYTNYSWTQSEYDAGEDFRPDEVLRLPGQSPHVVNAALNYNQGRFTGQVAYHWTAASIVHHADEESPAPSVSSPIFRDRYEDGASDLSASVRFRITQNFRFWADATNLLRDERIQYVHSRTLYAMETDRSSRVFRLGLRFDL